jgi:hypothetical protein
MLKYYANFTGENILNFDLNNIPKLLFKNLTEDTDIFSKKIKIFLDSFGLDKFHQKYSMLPNFGVEITYGLV